jgi:hypothetical protein
VSLIVRVPVRFAFAVGVKVTEIVQVNPDPNAPQYWTTSQNQLHSAR